MKVRYKAERKKLIVHDQVIGKTIVCLGDRYELEDSSNFKGYRQKLRYIPGKDFKEGVIRNSELFNELYKHIKYYNHDIKKFDTNRKVDIEGDSMLDKIRGLEQKLREELRLFKHETIEEK